MTFQAYLDTIKEKTGLGPSEFRELASAKGLLEPGVKTGAILAWLRAEFGLGSGHAMAIAATFTERAPDADRIEKQFSGAKNRWRPTFEALLAVTNTFGVTNIAPTDTYISLVKPTTKLPAKFAIVAFTADRMDVGIKLKGVEPAGRLAAAGSWNAMVTHRVRITDPAQVDAELVGWLRRAYDAI
ncbi:MAG: DUF4287 domain-containing protein [Salinibacterium sp.]|nr:DUF4287 domain-containing protein [Salinibacterium sp.]